MIYTWYLLSFDKDSLSFNSYVEASCSDTALEANYEKNPEQKTKRYAWHIEKDSVIIKGFKDFGSLKTGSHELLSAGDEWTRALIFSRIDTPDHIFGYQPLDFDMLILRDSLIEISGRVEPVLQEPAICYKFIYYHTFLYQRGIPDKLKTGELIQAVSILEKFKTSKLKINGNPFTGCLKIAARFVKAGISSHYSGYNILTLHYRDGKVQKHKLLNDVDLKDEIEMVRPSR